MTSEVNFHRSVFLSHQICLFLVWISLGLVLNGCSKSNMMMPMGSASPAFAFVANSGSGNISVFTVSASGALSPVMGSPFSAGAGAEFLAFDSMHKLLFASNQNANTLSVFSVNTGTGMLTPVAGSPFATGAMPHSVVVDSMGQFVFVGNQNDNSVSVFAIQSSGALTPVAGSPFAGINSPFGLALNPAGTVLFVNNVNGSTVSSFQVNRTSGVLTPIPGSTLPTGTTPIGIAADPMGKFLFVGDHMTDSISAFNIDSATGSLTRMGGPPATAPSCSASCHLNPLRLTVDPMDRFLFVTDVGANQVSSFMLSNGTLSPSAAPAATGQHPFGVALDPSSSFLFVANKVDNTISVFSVNASTGALTPISGSPFAAGGAGPTGIVVIPAM